MLVKKIYNNIVLKSLGGSIILISSCYSFYILIENGSFRDWRMKERKTKRVLKKKGKIGKL